MRVLNFGSINIDMVYRVSHIARPGETLASSDFSTNAGGKGANQSVALAKAGVEVFHAGKIGNDGLWLKEKLHNLGVDTTYILVGDCKTGNALIQVDEAGENSIVLYGGGNQEISESEIQSVLDNFSKGDILLIQNEISSTHELIGMAHEKGMIICFNPAPFHEEIRKYPLEKIDTFIVNEIEGCELARGIEEPEKIIDKLTEIFKGKEIILTMGEKGVLYGKDHTRAKANAIAVDAVDTTAAGDTFIGYYLAAVLEGNTVEEALEYACKVSSVTVSRKGAMDSIPFKTEFSGS